MIDVRELSRSQGSQPLRDLVQPLEPAGRGQGDNGPDRLAAGNSSNLKGVGSSLFEYRINFGPGYRIYFGKDGERLVILVGGGTKKRQQHDIDAALANWQDYKRRKQANHYAPDS